MHDEYPKLFGGWFHLPVRSWLARLCAHIISSRIHLAWVLTKGFGKCASIWLSYITIRFLSLKFNPSVDYGVPRKGKISSMAIPMILLFCYLREGGSHWLSCLHYMPNSPKWACIYGCLDSLHMGLDVDSQLRSISCLMPRCPKKKGKNGKTDVHGLAASLHCSFQLFSLYGGSFGWSRKTVIKMEGIISKTIKFWGVKEVK